MQYVVAALAAIYLIGAGFTFLFEIRLQKISKRYGAEPEWLLWSEPLFPLIMGTMVLLSLTSEGLWRCQREVVIRSLGRGMSHGYVSWTQAMRIQNEYNQRYSPSDQI